MNGLQDLVFIGEIALQAKIAKRAAERLEDTQNNFDKIEIWCSIQSILVATGNVSKIFWPTRKNYKQRGERLRHLLKVENDNPISDRRFRNHFEHFDERIEDWFENSSSSVHIDLAMNPSLPPNDIPPNTHRGYNSFNNTLIFKDDILDLNEILTALEEIHSKCKWYVLD